MFSTAPTNLPHQVLAQLSQLTSSLIKTTANPGLRSTTTTSTKPRTVVAKDEQKLHAESTATAVAPAAATPSISSSETDNLISSTSFPKSNLNILDIGSSSRTLNPNPLALELSSHILLHSSSDLELDSLFLQSGFLNLNAVSRFWEKVATRVSTNCSNWDSGSLKSAFLHNYVRTLDSSSLAYRSTPCHGHGPTTPMTFKTLGSFDLDRRYPFRPPPPFDHSVFNHVPNRTFKTNRDKTAEQVRNPSIFVRIKNKLFPPFPSAANPSKPGESSTTPPVQFGVNSKQQERLKALMAELPADEASKLKIAFAEGYIAATPSSNQSGTSRTERWLRTLQQLLGIGVFTAILAYLMGAIGGGGFRVNVGNGNEVQPEDINVTFVDVKGVDEAKAELQEIVEFLRSPEKFVQLGGKLPKGVLLVGPPGTGKTLLARAVAGEAGVPFFQAAGPEFDEILVGQGARRVRDLFKAAKVKAPCVIFIDEIDSVGAKRTNSVLHPYANQTINQLLTEMDGFRQNEGVIVLGATNRREDLDKALLRPGRFDVEVNVPAPELKGRKDILDYYLGRIKKGDDVDVDNLARGTTGFTGADLENMVNQAALRAAIEGADRVFKKHLDFARDKVLMGPERKTRIPDEETNRITAYHEAGHAIVAHYTTDSHPLHKVTIIPRGQSLGHTAYIPDKERYHVTRSQLMAMMDTMMGGRAAEELIFGIEKITSGASSDLKQATSIASQMVKEWGMSEKVGLRTVEDNTKSLVSVNELGNGTNELIDKEINRLLNESYERAKGIIIKHAHEHESLADALMKYETLDAEDVKAIFAGKANTIGPKREIKPTKPQSPTPPSSSGPGQGQSGGIGPFGIGKRNSCP